MITAFRVFRNHMLAPLPGDRLKPDGKFLAPLEPGREAVGFAVERDGDGLVALARLADQGDEDRLRIPVADPGQAVFGLRREVEVEGGIGPKHSRSPGLAASRHGFSAAAWRRVAGQGNRK